VNKYSGDKIKESELDWACRTYGGEERYIRVLVGKQEGKAPLGRHKVIWEDNIKMDVQEVKWGRGLD
jgi:hypothetical protein